MERRSAASRVTHAFHHAFLASLAATVSLAAIGAASALAAPAAGAIEGVARDAAGKPLAGVSITLLAPDGHVAGRAVSDAKGAYRFTGLAPGQYSVSADKTGFVAAIVPATVTAESGGAADVALTAAPAAAPAAAATQQPEQEITIIAKRLEEARLSIQPQIGASTYTITKQAIQNQPGGENNPINQVLLQGPGVAQDNLANGAIHVRNEHLNVQYRINGVIIPEGVSFFGQGLGPRFANSMQLITGALPAEYGLRTAGIVDIQTKSGLFAPGGSAGIYGGSYATVQPNLEYGGSADGYNYYVSGDYLHSNHGLDAVTPAYNQIHDNTNQAHGFAYVDKIIDATSKLSLISGVFDGQFQIPNNPGQPSFFTDPTQTINGVPISAFDSAQLNERQTENNEFAVASYLRSEQELTFQASAFTKYSLLHFHPDGLGDINFNGISQEAQRTSFANGLQLDSSYKIAANHTLRAGLLWTGERVSADTTSDVLPVVGTSFGSTPESIIDNHAKTGWTYSAYLQDEWRITPTVTLNYGGRFDVVNEFTSGNQISPRINTVWQATPSTTVHAGYANYFTPPPFELVSTTSVNLFAGTSGAPASTQNSPVKPERAQYFDVGVAQDVALGLKVGVDAYYKYAHDLIDESQFGAPVILTPFNYRVGINKGVEITTTYDNGPYSYYGNLALAQQKAEQIVSAQFNFTPEDLAFAASHPVNTDHSQFMTASAGMSYLWRGTRFSADIIAGSGVRTTRSDGPLNGGTVPSYEQVNLGVSHRFEDVPGGPLTLRLDVFNLLDEIYLIRSQLGTGVLAPQFGPRRTLFAGITKEF
jgi:outer membrane receptor protein involved in Fe transport